MKKLLLVATYHDDVNEDRVVRLLGQAIDQVRVRPAEFGDAQTLTGFPGKMAMAFDDDGDAKGTVELIRGQYGPAIVVNGREIGFVDLHACQDGGPAALILTPHEEYPDDLFAKFLIPDDRTQLMELVVNKFIHEGSHKVVNGIYGDWDRVFIPEWVPEPKDAAAGA